MHSWNPTRREKRWCAKFITLHSRLILDDLKLNQKNIPVITHVPHPAECLLNIFSLFVLHAPFLQDQYDIIEKHTQSGLELVEKYVKFVKERTEIEQNYAKQLR